MKNGFLYAFSKRRYRITELFYCLITTQCTVLCKTVNYLWRYMCFITQQCTHGHIKETPNLNQQFWYTNQPDLFTCILFDSLTKRSVRKIFAAKNIFFTT